MTETTTNNVWLLSSRTLKYQIEIRPKFVRFVCVFLFYIDSGLNVKITKHISQLINYICFSLTFVLFHGRLITLSCDVIINEPVSNRFNCSRVLIYYYLN